MNFTSSLNYVERISQDASGSLNLYGSGSTGRTEILSVDGNNGRLFTVTDDLSDSLFSANTIAGLPVIEAFANNCVSMGQFGGHKLEVTSTSIRGGKCTTASGVYSFVGGGQSNVSSGCSSTISGGAGNTASGACATIGGGRNNTASGIYSTVSGGYFNTACGCYSVVSSGYGNTACAIFSTVGGGIQNTACANFSTVSGGRFNTSSGTYSTISGGYKNTSSGAYSFVGGGRCNTASACFSFVGGGYCNLACGTYSTVSGGYSNQALGNRSTVGGGQNNAPIGAHSTISGGYGNGTFSMFYGTGNCAVVAGGLVNNAAAEFSGILGGRANIVRHACSFIIGVCLNSTTTNYTFVNNLCNVGGGTSDCRLKENIKSIPYGLSELSRLQPVCYNFKTDESKKTKYGFIAQCIQEVMPDLIYNHPTDTVEGTPVLQFDKEAVWASMVNAIKELKQRVEELESKVN